MRGTLPIPITVTLNTYINVRKGIRTSDDKSRLTRLNTILIFLLLFTTPISNLFFKQGYHSSKG